MQEERGRGRAAPARQWLLDRSCTIMASVGLGYMETFRAAPRIIRRLAFQGVVMLISFYEVRSDRLVGAGGVLQKAAAAPHCVVPSCWRLLALLFCS